MNDSQAKPLLEAFARREKLNPGAIKALHRSGYIEATRITLDSKNGEEYFPTFITVKGRRVLEG